jgi:hypothetical protein
MSVAVFYSQRPLLSCLLLLKIEIAFKIAFCPWCGTGYGGKSRKSRPDPSFYVFLFKKSRIFFLLCSLFCLLRISNFLTGSHQGEGKKFVLSVSLFLKPAPGVPDFCESMRIRIRKTLISVKAHIFCFVLFSRQLSRLVASVAERRSGTTATLTRRETDPSASRN